MKYIARVFLFNVFALWFTSQIFPGFKIQGSWQSVIIAGIVLSILMIFIRPILKILFIPINILTFGVLSWFVNVIVLYLLTVLLTEVEILPWVFMRTDYYGFVIPEIHFSYFVTLILSAISITFFSNLLHNISET
jgi:uncharacterized membrane protein YvlD (DUF360 family)